MNIVTWTCADCLSTFKEPAYLPVAEDIECCPACTGTDIERRLTPSATITLADDARAEELRPMMAEFWAAMDRQRLVDDGLAVVHANYSFAPKADQKYDPVFAKQFVAEPTYEINFMSRKQAG